MGTNCAQLLANLIFHSREAEIIQKLVREEKINQSLWPSTQHSGISTT